MISDFTVSGMTCGHCAAAVQNEISKLPGVSLVEVDLPTGKVRVTSEAKLENRALREAVAEAGYQLVDPLDDKS